MPQILGPGDIEKADFAVTLQGYARKEVDSFLVKVAQTVRHLQATAENPYQTLGEEIGKLLQDARDRADEMVRRTEEETARLHEEAVATANRTREEAEQHAAGREEAADEKVLQLEHIEKDIRQRLHSVRKDLQAVAERLLTLESAGPDEANMRPSAISSTSETIRQSQASETVPFDVKPEEVGP